MYSGKLSGWTARSTVITRGLGQSSWDYEGVDKSCPLALSLICIFVHLRSSIIAMSWAASLTAQSIRRLRHSAAPYALGGASAV